VRFAGYVRSGEGGFGWAGRYQVYYVLERVTMRFYGGQLAILLGRPGGFGSRAVGLLAVGAAGKAQSRGLATELVTSKL
jgi:hypothetical protein